MATANLVQGASIIKANTSAAADTIVMRDSQGGVTNATETMSKLINSGAEVLAYTSVKTSAYSIATGDRFVYYDTSGGAFAVTFPLTTADAGRIVTLVNTANSTTALTLTMSGSDTCTNATLTTAYGYASYQADATAGVWRRIG